MAMRYYAPFPGDGGEPLRPPGPHALRIGDADRDAAAADLGEHYAAGRLTPDELDERLDAVFSAKTFGQLAQVMTDLPGPGRLPQIARPGGPGTIPGLSPYAVWQTAGFPHDGYFGTGAESWHAPNASMASFQSGQPEEQPTSSDRASRFAALALLLLAMLIWLFTALLFVKHGGYQGPYGYGPPGTFGHFAHTLQFNGPPSSQVTPVAP